jgi:hypothetical protein
MIAKLASVFLALSLLVPGSVLLATPAQAQTNLVVIDGGVHNISLKAIQSANGNIDVQKNFEILPEHVVSVHQFEDFTITPSSGMIDKVKVTDAQLKTTELQFNGNVVKPNLAVGSYLLDIIVSLNNGDKYAYETILVVLAPTQVFNQTNKQQVINTFVKVSVDIKIIFKDTPEPEPSICYFNPNDPRCDPVNGKCPDGWAMNEDGQCHPGGKCPDGYARVDDDETGTCYPERDIIRCENGAIVLKEDDCAIYDPPIVPLSNMTGAEQNTGESNMTEPTENSSARSSGSGGDNATEEPKDDVCLTSFGEDPAFCGKDQEFATNENGEPLDSICGGEPCTSSEKEDSTTSDEVPESESDSVPPSDEETEQEESNNDEPEVEETSDEEPEESESESDEGDSQFG